MKDWKTTICGIIMGLPLIITTITPYLPPKYALIATGVGAILHGIVSKDGDTLGGDKS